MIDKLLEIQWLGPMEIECIASIEIVSKHDVAVLGDTRTFCSDDLLHNAFACFRAPRSAGEIA